MQEKAPRRTLEDLLGNVLRAGVLSAAVVVFAGGVWLLLASGTQPVAYSPFRGEPASLRSVAGIFKGLPGGGGRGLIQMGLLLLMATPLARVVLAFVAFAARKDGLYAAISGLVLAALLYSIFLGG